MRRSKVPILLPFSTTFISRVIVCKQTLLLLAYLRSYSRTPFLPASRTQGAERTAVIGPLTLYLVPARSTASGIRSPRHLCRQSPPPRPCSPSPHCSHYILITSEDYPRPRHAQRISSSNFRGDVSDIRASTTTRRRQRSLRYRRLCRRPLYNRTKTRKTKRHFIMN